MTPRLSVYRRVGRPFWIAFLLGTFGLLAFSEFLGAETVKLRSGGSGAATAVVPGTTTVTGCQNRVIFGDNSEALNCEAAFGYVASTNTLTADVVTAGLLGGVSVMLGPTTGTRLGILGPSPGGLVIRGNMHLGWNSSTTDAGGGADTTLNRESAAVVQMGVDVNGAAVAQTLKSHDGITGTDVAGSNFIHAAGRGTGAGASGDVLIQTATPLATGTTAQSLATRQHVEGGFRALTDATATTVFTVTTGNDVACSGTAEITVEAQDAANVQATRVIVSWAAVDATAGAGGEACASGLIGTNVSAASSGTLTVTTDATTGTDLCNIRVTATGSLTETVGPRARYQVRMDPGSSTCVVNPQ